MGRAKKKRVATMRRRAKARWLARAEFLTQPIVPVVEALAMGHINTRIYKHVQALVDGREPPPFVASGVVEVLFEALERSGMRRIRCDKCGNEWMTRSTEHTCPPCREKVTN
jgi:hypothetical protein